MSETKTHFRKVYKSDHLGVSDLEEMQEEGMTKFVFLIDHVNQELEATVAGRKGHYNIAYFKQPKNGSIKPFVLNAGNAKIVSNFAASPFVEDWKNIPVELFIDHKVKMKGVEVGGVRIKQVMPNLEKKKPTFKMANFEAALAKNATIEMIEKHYTVSPATRAKYLKQFNNQNKQ